MWVTFIEQVTLAQLPCFSGHTIDDLCRSILFLWQSCSKLHRCWLIFRNCNLHTLHWKSIFNVAYHDNLKHSPTIKSAVDISTSTSYHSIVHPSKRGQRIPKTLLQHRREMQTINSLTTAPPPRDCREDKQKLQTWIWWNRLVLRTEAQAHIWWQIMCASMCERKPPTYDVSQLIWSKSMF